MDMDKLAELIGIILGDGHLHKKQNCATIVGSLEDFYYYKQHVIPLIKSLFDVNPKLRKRNDRNAHYIQFSSKKVFDYLLDGVGLIRGNKVNARIPNLIMEDKKLMIFFLRGLFDTDGCLKFSKQKQIKNYYPRIQLAFRRTKFVDDVEKVLKSMKFKYGRWEEERVNGLVFLQISGKENLERWMDIIKPSNGVHLSKYLFWKEFGYYIPKSSLFDRINSLSLNITVFS